MVFYNSNIKSIIDLIKAFPDEITCIKNLEEIRWRYNIISPFDKDSINRLLNNMQVKTTYKGLIYGQK